MNEVELAQKIEDLSKKVDAIYISSEKTRKYFLWTMIISVVLFVVPLIGLIFAVPSFLSSYTSSLSDPTSNSSGSTSLQQQLNNLTQ